MTTFAPIKNMSQRPIFKANPKKLNFDSDSDLDEEYILTDEEYILEDGDYDDDESWEYYKRLWGNLSGPPKIDMLDSALHIVGYQIVENERKNITWNAYRTLWREKTLPNLTELGDALGDAGYDIFPLN